MKRGKRKDHVVVAKFLELACRWFQRTISYPSCYISLSLMKEKGPPSVGVSNDHLIWFTHERAWVPACANTVALSLLATNPLSTFSKNFSRLLNFLTFFESFKASGTFMSRAHLSYRCVYTLLVFSANEICCNLTLLKHHMLYVIFMLCSGWINSDMDIGKRRETP